MNRSILGFTISARSLVGFAAIIPLALAAETSFAVGVPSGPATSSNGTYTIYYPYTWGGAQCFVNLQEKSGTQWVSVNDSNHDGIVEFVAKPAGLFQYRSYAECMEIVSEDDEEDEWEEWEETSGSITVQVGSTPTVDSWDVQLDYVYEARFNGVQDIYLKRETAADPGNGTIDTLILRSSGGSFESIVPTAAQIANASTWPIADVDVLVDDINVDGFVDLTIKGLESLISGATNQIVFAPGQVFSSTPMGVRNLDQNLVNFANDMVSYYVDPDYFEDNATTYEVEGYWIETIECGWSWSWGDEEDDEFTCWDEWVWVDGYEVTNYPGINNDAVQLWELISGSATQSTMKDFVAQMLGVVIGGGPFCIDFGADGNDDECHGLEIYLILVALGDAAESQHTKSARTPGTIYLTGHPWAKVGPMHTALEFTTNIAGVPVKRTLSAEKIGQYLASEPNRPEDMVGNITLSTVTSYLAQYAGQPLLHWGAMEVADSHFKDDCLIYAPTMTSNSYTAGLLSVTGSILATGSMSDYLGGASFVPNVYFTSATPCP